jgi:hypothetical protein
MIRIGLPGRACFSLRRGEAIEQWSGRRSTGSAFAAPCSAPSSPAFRSPRRRPQVAAPRRLASSPRARPRSSRRATGRRGSAIGSAPAGWRVAGVEIPSAFGQRGRSAAIAAARLDFADALWDVRTVAAGAALDRVAVTRSLHELWHLRGEVFAHVALLHDQAEAERRVAVLDRHFEQRGGAARRRARAGTAARAADR